MDDLISRQTALEALEWNWAGKAAIDAIKNLPTAQPKIIRCKDCKHSEYWYRDKRRCFLWYEEGIGVFEDGYCNYAGRRDDGRSYKQTDGD